MNQFNNKMPQNIKTPLLNNKLMLDKTPTKSSETGVNPKKLTNSGHLIKEKFKSPKSYRTQILIQRHI